MLFIGHTRFSVYQPQSGAWKATNGTRFKSEQDYRNYLFSDERLASRADIFFGLSLPQLAEAAKNHAVIHLISYSHHLPTKYETRLIEAADKHDFLVLDKMFPSSAAATTESVAREALFSKFSADPYQPFGVYRLDDDDLLPADYFDRHEKYIKEPFVGMQVSLGTGITAIYSEGKFVNARRCYHPMLAIGFMSIQRFTPDGLVRPERNIAHNLSDRHFPVIMDSSGLGYVWTRQVEQDTSLGLASTNREGILTSIRNHINANPPIDGSDQFEKYFPILKGKLTAAEDARSTHEQLIERRVEMKSTVENFTCQPVSGDLSITVKMVCDMSAVEKNSLLSFSLVDASGKPVPVERVAAHMAEQGVTLSGNPTIGWFRYLNTRPGQNRTKAEFSLPQGVFLSAVTVRKWKKTDTSITLHSLTVESS
ncbi:hypothetical protein DQ353_00165 [Arthrobacter sp. AQ5-05]|uniref:glycosyltransferase n=1 Tax=Arthrobacter sp. AQ5-05 TaxID=2184581 RepID=UPI000DCBDA07|nr:glycosyltransferase [Arthrobacter sp. AQ5-05]RAX50852.1 hypothetical protein DQ353_00165 [Arthrobacter sp. AQ5-05]